MKTISAKTISAMLVFSCIALAEGNTLRFALRADPKSLDPLMVTEESADTIRYLTQAPLVRLNRKTQLAEPALATSWKVLDGGRTINITG